MSRDGRAVAGRAARVAALAAAVAVGAAAAAPAQTVITGRSAQALRCAVYVGMAGHYGFAEGVVSAEDRDLLTYWSTLVLGRWVPLDAPGQLAAYRAAMGELREMEQPYATIARYTDWCLASFSPAA